MIITIQYEYVLYTTILILITSYLNIQLKLELQLQQDLLNTKQRFIKYLSHEMRNPLHSLSLGLKWLETKIMKSRDHDTAIMDVLEDLRNSCKTAEGVLNELLSIEKIDAGITELDRCQLPLSSVLSAAMEPFESQVILYSTHKIL